MILEAIKYIRLQGKSKEWAIEGQDGDLVHFGNINLIVGKNAAGKSRTLSIIRDIANLLTGSHKLSEAVYSNARYQLMFKEKKTIYEYSFGYDNKEIIEETLIVNGKTELDRKNKILFSDISKKLEPHGFDSNQLSTSNGATSLNSALAGLRDWGESLKNAAFTNQIEKNYHLDDLSKLERNISDLIKEPVLLLHTFWKGRQYFGDEFLNQIRKHMTSLGYPIQMVDILEGPKGYSLYVKEEELDDVTSQLEMSQGMFRALSFIILLNFALMSNISVCVLVDDLGEGLDFDRSKILIDILVKNLNKSNLQIFITTNDRYIMNKVPLKYWSVLKRYPKKSVFYNYYNSKKIFDDFKYTGLSNFDFLATDFYLTGFGESDD